MAASIQKLFNLACTQFNLLHDGDRILVGLSGGKDSLLLTRLMAERARIHKPSISVAAAHVAMEHVPYQADIEYLNAFCQSLHIPLHLLHATLPQRAQKPVCFVCAQTRRRALLHFAQEQGFNQVALGHHQDDFLTTMLMNLVYEGAFHSMQPLMPLRHFALSIIRPLCLMPEQIVAEQMQHAVREKAPCPHRHATTRTTMRTQLHTLLALHPEARQSMWHALVRQWNESNNNNPT